MLAAWTAQAATYYGFKIGGVAVNSDNYTHVTGSTISGSVSYNPSTNTVTLTNVTISRTGDYNRCIYNESNNGLIVNFSGTNNLSAADAAAVRLDSYVGMTMNVLDGTTTISSVDEEAIYVTSNSNYTLGIYAKNTGKLIARSTNKAGIASSNNCILSLGGAVDIYGKKGAIDWKHQVVFTDANGPAGVTMRATNNSSYPVFKAGDITFFNGNQIILPSGAVWDSSKKTITLNGSAVYNQDILIGRDCAVLINATNFPDTNLRNYLLDKYPKGYITTTELTNLTTLNVKNYNISSLTGVKLLTNLVNLICSNNNLTQLNVSGLTKLEYLECINNPSMSYLNVTGCTALEDLYCGSTALSSINVSSCTALGTLNCSNTKVTELRVPDMPHLCYLNVSNCTQLKHLYCYDNPEMVQVTLTGCTALEGLWCYNSPVFSRFIGLTDCTSLANLLCYNCSLTSLTEVQSLNNLVVLSCMNNYLTTLTISGKSKLTDLYCQNNPNLTTLTVTSNPKLVNFNSSNCTALTKITAWSNNLTTFIITGCTALSELRCYYNDNLQTITGLNTCTALTYLDCEDCAITDLTGVNNMPNLATLYARNNKLTSLTVTGKTKLTSLRVNGNTTLLNLDCFRDALTTLNVTGCTALEELRCYENSNLATITGLADCKAITHLDCEDCAITDLDGVNNMNNIATLLARNNKLSTLIITSKSSLTYLRVSGNKQLTNLKCFYNGLTSLDVKDCSAMTYLDCCGNKLTSLMLSGCTALNHLEVYRNQISGSGMTTLVNSLPTRSSSNKGELLAIYISNESNTMTAAQITTARNKYWLPKKWSGGSWVEMTASLAGDVNSDGEINISDVIMLISIVLNSDTPTPGSDFNGDNDVNITDVTALITYVLNN